MITKKTFLFMLIIFIFLTNVSSLASNQLKRTSLDEMSLLSPVHWSQYKNINEITSQLNELPNFEKVIYLAKDEQYIEKYYQALETENMQDVYHYFPSSFFIALEKHNANTDLNSLKELMDYTLENLELQIENEGGTFDVIKKNIMYNKPHDLKGYYVEYKTGLITNLLVLFGKDNNLVTFMGLTTKDNVIYDFKVINQNLIFNF
ncbi:MAG: hypothetical protein ACOCQR_02000 [bacterium]